MHELISVLGDAQRADRLRLGRSVDLPAEDDVRGTLGAHHRDLIGGPGQ